MRRGGCDNRSIVLHWCAFSRMILSSRLPEDICLHFTIKTSPLSHKLNGTQANDLPVRSPELYDLEGGGLGGQSPTSPGGPYE